MTHLERCRIEAGVPIPIIEACHSLRYGATAFDTVIGDSSRRGRGMRLAAVEAPVLPGGVAATTHAVAIADLPGYAIAPTRAVAVPAQ